MISEAEKKRLRRVQGDYEGTRERVWVDRIGAGLAYRRSLREIEERVQTAREDRDQMVLDAVEAGGSYREVAAAVGISHSRVQQIVGAKRQMMKS